MSDAPKPASPPATPSTSPSRGRSLVGVVLAALVGGAAAGGGVWLMMRDRPRVEAPTAVVEAPLYQCPMHPTVSSDHPGDCPICGMKLVKVERGAASPAQPAAERGGPAVKGLAPVTIDPARQQLIGLATAPVKRAPVAERWQTVGRVTVDPTGVRKTNVKVEGYVERVFVDFVGRAVKRGDPLFSMYSPRLLSAQSEYLLALKMRAALTKSGAQGEDGETLVKSARRKLELWDVPEAEIERLEKTGEPSKTLTFVSPISGVVTDKKISEGSRLAPGDLPYEITDLSMVWVMADAYESDLARVKLGSPATLTLSAYPGRAFKGQVSFVDPLLDPASRTLKVHLHFPNPTGELKPEMFGEVALQGSQRQALVVPADALIHAGTRDVVFLALGEGRFQPREVKVGAKMDALVEILEGLEEGQLVVTRANFLIDSESQLRSSLSALGGP